MAPKIVDQKPFFKPVALSRTMLSAALAASFLAVTVNDTARAESVPPTSERFAPSGFNTLDARFGSITGTDLLRTTQLFSVAGDGVSSYGEFRYSNMRSEDPMNSLGEPEFERTSFNFSQAVGTGTFHFGSEKTHDEYRLDTGVSIGRATLSLSTGRGSGAPTLGRAMGFIDHNFFYGGNGGDYDMNGGTLQFGLTTGVAALFGRYQVSSPNLDDRQANVFGLNGNGWQANLVQIERGTQTAGHGVDLKFQRGAIHTRFAGIRSTTEAYSTKIQFGITNRKRQVFGFEVQRDRNPLYRDSDDTRFLLTFSGRLGGRNLPIFGANESTTADNDDEEAKTRKRNRVFGGAIAVGAGIGVAAALSGSSGDENTDNGARFGRAQGAAFAVLNNVNPRSIAENREYGGYIFRRPDGSFSFHGPLPGEVASVNLGDPQTAVPSGTRSVATYHTHGGPDPRFDNENFSPQDISLSRRLTIDGYLGTPGGFMKLYNFNTDAVSVIGRIRTQ